MKSEGRSRCSGLGRDVHHRNNWVPCLSSVNQSTAFSDGLTQIGCIMCTWIIDIRVIWPESTLLISNFRLSLPHRSFSNFLFFFLFSVHDNGARLQQYWSIVEKMPPLYKANLRWGTVAYNNCMYVKIMKVRSSQSCLYLSSSGKGLKNSGVNGDSSPDLCDVGAMLHTIISQLAW